MAGEAVFLIEPTVEFSLVYERSATGSLRIISKLRGLVTPERLRDLAIIIATTLISNAVGHFQGKAMDEVVESVVGEGVTLTDADIERIAEAVVRVQRSETVRAPRREFYRAVEQDSAITGVGALPNSQSKKPDLIVPRTEFLKQATNHFKTEGDPGQTFRVLPKRTEVVVIQPPLVESNRQWRLFSDGVEFGAKMLDFEFKQQILEGTTELKLATGIILDITLEIAQVKEGDLWKNKSFAVAKVHSWRQNPKQAELLLSHRSNDDDQSN